MIHETRVNLLHLLEDIRDSYAVPLEEAIIAELIANALDSGATRLEFTADLSAGFIRLADNGRGMRRAELKDYHNIAATAKIRGRGIGFAGVGAKLSLLLAERVITETKGPYGAQSATQWHLENSMRAPWKFVPFGGVATAPKGTSVTVFLRDNSSPLLDSQFVSRAIQRHYHGFFHAHIAEKLNRYVYRKAVEFWVNGMKLDDFDILRPDDAQNFEIFLGRKNRLPVGFGYLSRQAAETNARELNRGLAISTFGKIIKTGWEWVGIAPRSYASIYGLVEIPGLAEILTTNKADFLNDASSLKKYYRYRKAVQEAVHPILQKWGEERTYLDPGEKHSRPLEREIEEVLGTLLIEFPELAPLVGTRHRPYGGGTKGAPNPREEYLAGIAIEGAETAEEAPRTKTKSEKKEKNAPFSSKEDGTKNQSGRKKEHGLRVGFEEDASDETLARLAEDTVWVNTRHPAWEKSRRKDAEDYHVIIAAAWALSSFIEEGRSAQKFVARFLSAWGKEKEIPKLF